MTILGEEGRRRLVNRIKTNDQLFADYTDKVKASLSPGYARDIEKFLGRFKTFIGNFPPTVELATSFLAQYSHLMQNTRARYCNMLKGFYSWYGEPLPLKVKSPKLLPTFVSDEDVEKVMKRIQTKRKQGRIELDEMLVELPIHTGLRRGEMAALKVGDIVFTKTRSILFARAGKGSRDRDIPLNSYIAAKLKHLVKGKKPTDKVIGLAAKTITQRVGIWAKEAGVPQLTPHALRHKFAIELSDQGVNLKIVQELMGHESLATTEIYLRVTDKDKQHAVDVLDPSLGRVLDSDASKVRPGDKDYDAKEATLVKEMAPAYFDPISSSVKPLTYAFFSIDITDTKIIIDNLKLQTSDPSLPFKLMLFNNNPDTISDWQDRDLVGMGMVNRPVINYRPPGNGEYENLDGEPKLHGGIEIGQRSTPIELLSSERKGDRADWQASPASFTVNLRYYT